MLALDENRLSTHELENSNRHRDGLLDVRSVSATVAMVERRPSRKPTESCTINQPYRRHPAAA